MPERMKHTDVQKVMSGLADAGLINIDVPVRTLVESTAKALPRDTADELSLHVLCCNEYFLVTGLTNVPLEDIAPVAGQVRGALG